MVSETRRLQLLEAGKRYRKTEKGRAATARYLASDKYKAVQKAISIRRTESGRGAANTARYSRRLAESRALQMLEDLHAADAA